MFLILKLQHLQHTNTFKWLICGMLIMALLAVGIYPLWATSEKFPFEDVPSDHWARQSIYACWHDGVVNGVSETKFEPESTLTRAQFITMIGRTMCENAVQAQATASDNWYSSYVRYLSGSGYLGNIAVNEASLSQGISRQEMALIIYNICKEYNTEFDLNCSGALSNASDASNIDPEYKDAIEYCYYIGLLSGYEDGSFKPNGTLTRAEAATILRRANYWAKITSVNRSTLSTAGFTDAILNEITSSLIIDNINDWREANGLNRLETMEFMNEACMVRAEEISVSFSHNRPDGRAAGTVYEDLYGTEMGGLEIIVSDQNQLTATLAEAADALVELWKNSSGHNTAMLSDADYIGCGVYVSNSSLYSSAWIAHEYFIELGGYEAWA